MAISTEEMELEVMPLIGMVTVMVSDSQLDCGGGKTSYTIPDEADNGLLHTPTISMAKN